MVEIIITYSYKDMKNYNIDSDLFLDNIEKLCDNNYCKILQYHMQSIYNSYAFYNSRTFTTKGFDVTLKIISTKIENMEMFKFKYNKMFSNIKFLNKCLYELVEV